MNVYTKLLMTCFLIIFILSASGCQSVDNNNINKADNSLMSVEPFSDPELADTPVTCDNPAIKIISYKLIDNRKYEDDTNWSIQVVYENTGASPMWVTCNYSVLLNSYVREINPYQAYSFVKSGERGELTYGGEDFCEKTRREVPRSSYKGIVLEAYNTVIPEVSPELQHIKIKQKVVRLNQALWPAIFGLPADINSVKYKEDEHGWKYIVIGLTRHENRGQLDIEFDMLPYQFKKSPNPINITVDMLDYNDPARNLGAGNLEYIEIPLKESIPEDVYEIIVSNTVAYYG